MTSCADCGAEVPPDEPGSERQPCLKCGSLARKHEVSLSSTLTLSSSLSAKVERGITEARMAAFALILATALSVGLGVGFATSPLVGVLAAVAAAIVTALLLAAVYRIRRVRHAVMELMHRVTGQ